MTELSGSQWRDRSGFAPDSSAVAALMMSQHSWERRQSRAAAGATGALMINRAVPARWPPEEDLASFGPGVTFGFELGLEFRFGLEFGFDLEFGFGDSKIDHEAESVGKLPCR